MKILLLLVIATCVAFPQSVYATQGKHDKSDENSKYNCSVVGKPGNIKRLEQGRKKDGLNNGQIRLRWSDSLYAHRVEIDWGMVGGRKQTLKTGDDGRYLFTGLTNHKLYEFKVRGKSNCGSGKWSKTYQFLP